MHCECIVLFRWTAALESCPLVSVCDDIIRQHKAACLRITALLACKDILWIGTSAGVVATMHLPERKNKQPVNFRVAQLTS